MTEAILEHGAEAGAARDAFVARPLGDQQALIAYLNNLVLFKMDQEKVVIKPPKSVRLK